MCDIQKFKLFLSVWTEILMPGQRTEENELFFPVIFLIISIASYVTLGID